MILPNAHPRACQGCCSASIALAAAAMVCASMAYRAWPGDVGRASVVGNEQVHPVGQGGEAEVSPRAILGLAKLPNVMGDADGPQAAMRRAIASGHPDAVPSAARRLSDLAAR